MIARSAGSVASSLLDATTRTQVALLLSSLPLSPTSPITLQ